MTKHKYLSRIYYVLSLCAVFAMIVPLNMPETAGKLMREHPEGMTILDKIMVFGFALSAWLVIAGLVIFFFQKNKVVLIIALVLLIPHIIMNMVNYYHLRTVGNMLKFYVMVMSFGSIVMPYSYPKRP